MHTEQSSSLLGDQFSVVVDLNPCERVVIKRTFKSESRIDVEVSYREFNRIYHYHSEAEFSEHVARLIRLLSSGEGVEL
jgi:hypothetical protein